MVPFYFQFALHCQNSSSDYMVSLITVMSMTCTELNFLFQSDDPMIAAQISHFLANFSAWKKDPHLQQKQNFQSSLQLQLFNIISPSDLRLSAIIPSYSVRSIGVIFDDQLSFKDHIANTAQACRFVLYIIRKIKPFLTEHAAQLLVQAFVILRLDYCNALLPGFSSCSLKHFQIIQNAAGLLTPSLRSMRQSPSCHKAITRIFNLIHLEFWASGCTLHPINFISQNSMA